MNLEKQFQSSIATALETHIGTLVRSRDAAERKGSAKVAQLYRDDIVYFNDLKRKLELGELLIVSPAALPGAGPSDDAKVSPSTLKNK